MMFRKFSLTIALAMVVISAGAARSQAAIVTFFGSMESGSGSALGTLPPAVDFSLTLDFTQTLTGFATINNGLFSSSVASIDLVGGDIIVTENGANDQALFVIDSTSPSGSFSTTFTGDAITDNQVTTQNLVDLVNASSPATISANFGAGGSYTGQITSAVPEPSSGAMLLGLFGVATTLRRRRSAAKLC